MLKKKKRESCATPFCVNESNYNQKWMPLVAKHCLEKKKNKVLDTQRVKKKKEEETGSNSSNNNNNEEGRKNSTLSSW